MSTPQTTINICSGVMLDNRYIHSIYFESKAEQLAYFAGKVVKSFSGYSYCRKSWSIQVHAKLEEAREWNYLYFQNTPTGKWWYYFINQVEYINENTVELTLELDVIQTYLCDVTFRPCYVERQHTLTDNFGDNEVDEGLDVGELRCHSLADISELEELCILMISSVSPYTTMNGSNKDTVFSSRYNNVFGALAVFATPIELAGALGQKLYLMNEEGFLDSIVSMWMYPKKLVTLDEGSEHAQGTWENPHICMGVKSIVPPQGRLPVVVNPWGRNNVQNMKTLQYPFNFLQVSNNQGTTGVFRYERFGNVFDPNELTDLDYTLYGGYSPDAVAKLVFNNYGYMGHECGITLGNYPTCAWSADTYKIWLAQNQNQHAVDSSQAGLTITAGVGATVAGVATGNPLMALGGLGTAVGGLSQIAQLNAQKKDMSVQPPQARGAHSSSVNIAEGKHTFTAYHRCLDDHHMKMVDDFFTMYGYAIRQIQTPNIHARPYFTYIKTVGCTVSGDLCNEDRVKFESIIDNGITFWTTQCEVGDYSARNQPWQEV